MTTTNTEAMAPHNADNDATEPRGPSNDVRAQSQALSIIAEDHKALLLQPVTRKQWKSCLKEMKARYTKPQEKIAISNMSSFFNVPDPHLANLNNSKIAFEVWKHVVKAQEYSMLGEILEDIGQGCLQGISHRLFSYLLVFM